MVMSPPPEPQRLSARYFSDGSTMNNANSTPGSEFSPIEQALDGQLAHDLKIQNLTMPLGGNLPCVWLDSWA